MAPKRKLGEPAGSGSEEEEMEGLSFKWTIRPSLSFEPCSFGVTGTIVLRGRDVGEVRAIVVDRTYIREGLETYSSFLPGVLDVCREICLCTQAGDELCRAGSYLLNGRTGEGKYRPMLANEAWDPSAHTGGLLHIYMVRVAKEHRGKALGLRAVRYLLGTRLRDSWTLAIMKPRGEHTGGGFEEEDEAWHCKSNLESEGDDSERRTRESSERAAAEGVARYFARLGFSQAGPANDGARWWFLVKAKAKERTKDEARALPVAVQAPRPEFTAAESKLRNLAGRCCRLDKNELEAFILRRELDGEPLPEDDGPVDLAKATPLHTAAAEANHIGTFLKDRIPALVSLGCGVDQRDHLGYTPLFLAAGLLGQVRHQPRAIAALLDSGADASLPCPEGFLPHEEVEKKWYPNYLNVKSIEQRYHCHQPLQLEDALRCIQQQVMSFAAVIRLRLRASAGPPSAFLRQWYISTIDSIAAMGVKGPPSNAQTVKDHASDAKRPFNEVFFEKWQGVADPSPETLKNQENAYMQGVRGGNANEARKHGVVAYVAIPVGHAEEAEAKFKEDFKKVCDSVRKKRFEEFERTAQEAYNTWLELDSVLDATPDEYWESLHRTHRNLQQKYKEHYRQARPRGAGEQPNTACTSAATKSYHHHQLRINSSS